MIFLSYLHTVIETSSTSILRLKLSNVPEYFSKGVHTVPRRGFSPDFHVVFTTCCRLFA